MTPEEITKLAEGYAEDATKVMAGDPNLPASDLNGIKRDAAEYAEEVIRWLLRTHSMVEKSKAETAEEVTIDGWVARDSNGTLWICSEEPQRYSYWWIIDTDEEYTKKELPSYLFPSLTWESDPVEVTVIIKPKKI